MVIKNRLGQYFTTNIILKEKMFEFIMNNPDTILEPCMGRGDLIAFILDKSPCISFDMYEIDTEIKTLDSIERDKIVYGDFMQQTIKKTYKTIVGNPPYVRTKTGNLYIDFTKKCYDLLDHDGEMIFIVPSDFLKLTSASKLLNVMMDNGTFTHIYHCHNEKMFDTASIDVIVFRYCKNILLDKTVLYNDNIMYITNSNGLITFDKEKNTSAIMFQHYFDIYVGLVSGKESVYKNQHLGNIEILNGEGKVDKYIYIKKYPCANDSINIHLLAHKNELIGRSIRKLSERNWFEWGAPRNIKTINKNLGKDCIYLYMLTRRPNVSFVGKVMYFGSGLLMLKPKKHCDLARIVTYLNDKIFKDKFMSSGRFKIGPRRISNSYIPIEYL